jgi:hypothetical protein
MNRSLHPNGGSVSTLRQHLPTPNAHSPAYVFELSDMEIWLYIASDSIRDADKFIDFLYEKCTNLFQRPKLVGNGMSFYPAYVVYLQSGI